MSTFFICFRICQANVDNKTYDERHDAIMTVISEYATKVFKFTDSFIIFESESTTHEIAQELKNCVEIKFDLFIIYRVEYSTAIICGNNDDAAVYQLMPYLQAL
jgi:hypothetical protein